MEPHREVGSVWTARGRRFKVEVNHGDVVIDGTHLTPSEREDFTRIFFQACAEADGWEATVPP